MRRARSGSATLDKFHRLDVAVHFANLDLPSRMPQPSKLLPLGFCLSKTIMISSELQSPSNHLVIWWALQKDGIYSSTKDLRKVLSQDQANDSWPSRPLGILLTTLCTLGIQSRPVASFPPKLFHSGYLYSTKSFCQKPRRGRMQFIMLALYWPFNNLYLLTLPDITFCLQPLDLPAEPQHRSLIVGIFQRKIFGKDQRKV